MIASNLPDGTPVRLNKSVTTELVVFVRGSIGYYYGPPDPRGYVGVKIAGCIVSVDVQTLLMLDEPFSEEEPLVHNDTPESGGHKIDDFAYCDW